MHNRYELEPIEVASRDEIQALQLRRMRWPVNHDYRNVPTHRQRFDDMDVHPDDLKSLADLALFPFTVKTDLRDHYPFGMFVDMVARSLRASGTRAGDIVHNAYGYGLFTGGLRAHAGVERLGATVVPVSGGMTPRKVTLTQDFRPTTIIVTPSYMLNILEKIRIQRLDPNDCSLEVGILGAEPWTNAMRRQIEEAFDMHAVDIHGLSKMLGQGVANECVETKDGLHIWEDHFYFSTYWRQTTGLEPVRFSVTVDDLLS